MTLSLRRRAAAALILVVLGMGVVTPANAAPPPPPEITGWNVTCGSTWIDPADASVHAIYTVTMDFTVNTGGPFEARVYEWNGSTAIWSEAALYRHGAWTFTQTYPAAHVEDTVYFTLRLYRYHGHKLIELVAPVTTGSYTGTTACPA